MPQAHFRVSRSAQHLISPDDAKAYYGPCSPPPAPCPRPRGFNLEADLFNITPYHRFESFYHYKGDSGAGVGGSRVYVGGWVGGGWRVCVGGGGGGGGGTGSRQQVGTFDISLPPPSWTRHPSLPHG